MGGGGVTCNDDGSNPTVTTYSVLTASPLRGTVACMNAASISTRGGIVNNEFNGNTNQVPSYIYGPFEAGFTSTAGGGILSCLGSSTIDGGIDTGLSDALASHICGVTKTVLDYCGGHAEPYHYHESMSCLYSGSTTSPIGHSTRLGFPEKVPYIFIFYTY
jgi:hypothetical protein